MSVGPAENRAALATIPLRGVVISITVPPPEPPPDPRGFPSDKARFLCPHCNILSLHQLLEPSKTLVLEEPFHRWRSEFGPPLHPKITRHLIYRCVNCQKDTYVLFQDAITFRKSSSLGDAEITKIEPATVLHQFPIAIPIIHFAVPAAVREATVEAEKCLAVGAHNACGVMTRRAIHALCQDKKAKGKDLYTQLEFLRDSHAITPDLWQWAEDLRVVGRSGAHPEWEEVTPGDADYAVRFLREIIRYVYINPAERNTHRLKETKMKKQQPKEEEKKEEGHGQKPSKPS